ncbi:hypothetical protein M5D96_003679 [Drosophila gunungcola]|uniref:Uncharacterized protein n=1 Tax=Drosophila gunungcola TaxID=103775 RepID=A0A9Q0BRX3_9MUSC|nr:hypothetical protein M5D96_003679 [Drosophila gunungcola]
MLAARSASNTSVPKAAFPKIQFGFQFGFEYHAMKTAASINPELRVQ